MMKKSLLLLAALVLGGCATHWPESALLNPQVIPSNQQYYSGNRITMEGVDKREAAYVFSIKKKEKAPVLVNSSQPLNSLLAEKLKDPSRESIHTSFWRCRVSRETRHWLQGHSQETA